MTKRRTQRRLRRFLAPAVAVGLAGAAALYAAGYAVEAVERQAEFDVKAALASEGLDWVTVATNGMIVGLSGKAADEAARFQAVSVAGSVVDSARVVDAMDVVQPGGIEAPQFSVEILRNTDGVSVFGLIPTRSDAEDLSRRIAALSGRGEVTDLLETADYPVPKGWETAISFALKSLEKLPRAKVSVTAGAVTIEAIADSREARATTEAQLVAAAPKDVTLTLNILAPRPVITPYTLRAVLEDGALHFDACAAMTEQGRTRILEAAKAAGLPAAAQCTIGLGAPTTDWPEAVAAALAALKEVGAGSVTFSDGDVTLVAEPGTAQEEFDLAVGRLENKLPEGYSLRAVLAEKPDTTRADSIPQFVANRADDGTLQMRGRLADALSRTAVEAYAKSRFGAASVVQATRIDDKLPRGWSMRVLSGLEALSLLNEGVLTVRAETLSLRGRTGNAEAQAEISRLLSDGLGQGAEFTLDIAYAEELNPVSALPTPAECIDMINEVLATNPKITFAPSSTDIDKGALGTIDALADVLRQCQSVAIEIGGHTDSQGRETMNLNLSQARADAVLAAIMQRRVLTQNLSARGYGEEKPIADNGTEDGREANRRIEFTLLTSEQAAARDAEAGGENAEGDSDK